MKNIIFILSFTLLGGFGLNAQEANYATNNDTDFEIFKSNLVIFLESFETIESIYNNAQYSAEQKKESINVLYGILIDSAKSMLTFLEKTNKFNQEEKEKISGNILAVAIDGAAYYEQVNSVENSRSNSGDAALKTLKAYTLKR